MIYDVFKSGDRYPYCNSFPNMEEAVTKAKELYRKDYAEYTVENDEGDLLYTTSEDENLGDTDRQYIVEASRENGGDMKILYGGFLGHKALEFADQARTSGEWEEVHILCPIK